MKKFLCLLLMIGSQYLLYAQDKSVDSFRELIEIEKPDTAKINLLYELSDFYILKRYNIDSALFYVYKGIQLSKDAGSKKLEIKGLIALSLLQVESGKTDLAKKSLFAGLDINSGLMPEDLGLKSDAYERLSSIYDESNPDSAIYYNTKALQLAQNIKSGLAEFNASAGLGWNFSLLGNYPQAMKLFIRAQQLAEKMNDSLKIAAILRLIGNVYFFQDDVKGSIRYYDEAAAIGTKLKNERLFNLIFLSKARAYLKLNSLDSALYYAKLTFQISSKTYNHIVLSRIFNILGNIYEKMGKDEIALNYFRQGISFSLDHNSITSLIQTYNSLAQYFYYHQNIDSSIFYARKAIDIILETGFLLDEPETYSILSNTYKAKRNIDSSFKYINLMQAAKDSLFGIDKIQQIQLLVSDQEQQKKQQQAAELAYKNKVKFYALVAGIIILFIIAGLLWRSTRIKQKSYVQVKKQQEETDHQRKKAEQALDKLQTTQSQLIQSEKMASLGELTVGIAHEIQNPLNFVNNFSEVNKELIEEMKTELRAGNHEAAIAIGNDVAENENKINHHGKRADAIVKGMLQHSRTSAGLKELTDLNALADEYLRLSFQGFRGRDKSFNATIQTHFDAGIRKINIIPPDIGRALLNLYNNAFYAVFEKEKQKIPGYEPLVSVSTKQLDGQVEIRIKDNGDGIPSKIAGKIFQPFFTTKPTGQGTGLGLSISYDIIKVHGGELKVETEDGNGAEFVIHIPSA